MSRPIHNITIKGENYEIVDAHAREQLNTQNNSLNEAQRIINEIREEIDGLENKDLPLVGGDNVQISSVPENPEIKIISATDTTYTPATQQEAGLMSAEDKVKLDNISANADVSTDDFGKIRIGDNILVAARKQDILSLIKGDGIELTVDTQSNSIRIDAAITDIPEQVSEIDDTSQAANKTWSAMKIKSLLNSVSTLKIKNVQSLPIQNIKTDTMYLIPQENGDDKDTYVYVDGQWEMIGSTSVDLEDYYTKEEVDTLINSKQNKVQANWNQTNSSADDYIKNKPTIPIVNYPVKDVKVGGNSVVNAAGIANITLPESQQEQSDWEENDVNAKTYIKNKPDVKTYTQGRGIKISDDGKISIADDFAIQTVTIGGTGDDTNNNDNDNTITYGDEVLPVPAGRRVLTLLNDYQVKADSTPTVFPRGQYLEDIEILPPNEESSFVSILKIPMRYYVASSSYNSSYTSYTNEYYPPYYSTGTSVDSNLVGYYARQNRNSGGYDIQNLSLYMIFPQRAKMLFQYQYAATDFSNTTYGVGKFDRFLNDIIKQCYVFDDRGNIYKIISATGNLYTSSSSQKYIRFYAQIKIQRYKTSSIKEGDYYYDYKEQNPNSIGTISLDFNRSDWGGIFTDYPFIGAFKDTNNKTIYCYGNDENDLVIGCALKNYYPYVSPDKTKATPDDEVMWTGPIFAGFARFNTYGHIEPKLEAYQNDTELNNLIVNGQGYDSVLDFNSDNAVKNKTIALELLKKANSADLSRVATSGSYNDLSNKPVIPTKVSNLINDLHYTKNTDLLSLVNDGSYNSLTKELDFYNGASKLFSIDVSEIVKDGILEDVQLIEQAESGVSIQAPYFKFTFNTDSGKDPIRISLSQFSVTITTDDRLKSNSVNPIQNKAVYNALLGKADNEDIPTFTYDSESELLIIND